MELLSGPWCCLSGDDAAFKMTFILNLPYGSTSSQYMHCMCNFEFSMSVCVYAGAVLSAAATGFCTVKVMEWKMHSAALYSTQLHHQRELSTFICFSHTHVNYTTCPRMTWHPMLDVCSTCMSSTYINKLTQRIRAHWYLAPLFIITFNHSNTKTITYYLIHYCSKGWG